MNFFEEFKRLHSSIDELKDKVEKAAAGDFGIANELNSIAINGLVNAGEHRPHRFSTLSDYPSWDSLTDRTYSSRLLAPYYPPKPLPDPKALTTFFARKNDEQVLSTKSTCLFPAFAQYLTDGFIRTRMPHSAEDIKLRRRNTSNHEIDMCPLYGRTPEQTSILRSKSQYAGQRGRLKSQIISIQGRDEEFPPFLFEPDGTTMKDEFKHLDPPLRLNDLEGDPNGVQKRAHIFATGGDRTNTAPQVSMMNTLWLREHNRLAAAIERAYPSYDDERVFQTARNTVIVEVIKVVVEDYMNHISPSPIKFIADPSVAWNASWNKPNWITTEFSLLYRWHSLIPDQIVWNNVAVPVIDTLLNNELILQAPLSDSFVGISAQKAGRLGAFNTASALWAIEENSIIQGRVCNVAPYNFYRSKYLKRDPAKRYSDISGNPDVQQFLALNYGPDSPENVDLVDFYIGIFAEDPGVNSPLPSMITSMVAVDAFSQALTNPLISEHVYNQDTFSSVGWEAIQTTSQLEQVVDRNCPGLDRRRVSMTQEGWKLDWEVLISEIL